MTTRADMGAEAILIAGGGRAILLQLANPAIGRAIARHSDFASDPARRLRNTLTYVYAIVYGDARQVARVRTLVDSAHAPVERAMDAALQLWVAATLYDTAVLVYESIHGALGPEDADAVYRDYAELGSTLQMPPGLWPADREAFRRYWDAAVADLVVDDTARAVARELLYLRTAPPWIRVAAPLGRLVTAGLLGDDLRRAFGLPWSDRHERRFVRVMRLTAVVYPRLPRAARHWPKNHLLARL